MAISTSLQSDTVETGIHTVAVELDLDQYQPVRSRRRASQLPDLALADRYQFSLCWKNTALGDLSIRQWWMDRRGLYGDRKQTSDNRNAIIQCFWARCLREGSAFDDRAVQESYILAALLPFARSNASRRVFLDASLGKRRDESGLHRREKIEQLECALRSSRDKEIDALTFHRRTADALSPPGFSQEVVDCYQSLVTEIFDEACDQLRQDGISGLDIAIEHWSKKMKSICRRKGHQTEKQALDMLSFERRAAFHRCYSSVWLFLIEALSREYDFSDEEKFFHRFWHLEQVCRSNETNEANFHLFHGHVFALHPACGNLLMTKTGRELVGSLVHSQNDLNCQRRFFHGMWIAICDYANQESMLKTSRKKMPGEFPGEGFEGSEGKPKGIRRGRTPGSSHFERG